jgi:DNA-binding transcriptional LysR family regulator
LEEELGVLLVERGSRPVRLTDAGRLLYEQAVQVLERIEEIKAMTRRIYEAEQPRFSIGFVASTLYGYLPEVIRRYRAARPGVELTLLEMTTLEQIAALKEGRIDVGFGRIPFDDAAIERTLLRNEKLSAALPLAHALAPRPGRLRLEDLAGDALVVYPKAPRPSYADTVLALFRERELKPPVVHEVRELQTALGLVAAESGVCLVPASVERLRRDRADHHEHAQRRRVAGDRPRPAAREGDLPEGAHRLRSLSGRRCRRSAVLRAFRHWPRPLLPIAHAGAARCPPVPIRRPISAVAPRCASWSRPRSPTGARCRAPSPRS